MMEKPKKDIAGYVVGIILVLIFLIPGVLVSVNGFERKAENDTFMETAVGLEAKCVNIWRGSHSKADLKYEYEGFQYYLRDIRVRKSTKTGDIKTIYIHTDMPGLARTDISDDINKQILAGFAIAGIGVISLGIGISAFIYNRVSPNGIYYTKQE